MYNDPTGHFGGRKLLMMEDVSSGGKSSTPDPIPEPKLITKPEPMQFNTQPTTKVDSSKSLNINIVEALTVEVSVYTPEQNLDSSEQRGVDEAKENLDNMLNKFRRPEYDTIYNHTYNKLYNENYQAEVDRLNFQLSTIDTIGFGIGVFLYCRGNGGSSMQNLALGSLDATFNTEPGFAEACEYYGYLNFQYRKVKEAYAVSDFINNSDFRYLVQTKHYRNLFINKIVSLQNSESIYNDNMLYNDALRGYLEYIKRLNINHDSSYSNMIDSIH